jgi:hypothetical protein
LAIRWKRTHVSATYIPIFGTNSASLLSGSHPNRADS